MYYGIKMKADSIVCGSPQFYIGQYLLANEHHLQIMDGISKDNNRVVLLDELLPNAIEQNDYKGEIFLLMSSFEPSYVTHIIPLLDALKKYEYVSAFDAHYKKHDDIGLYFANYLFCVMEKMKGRRQNG